VARREGFDVPRTPRLLPPSSSAEGPLAGALLPQLTTAAICRVAWGADDPDGAYLYLYRLCGIVRRIAAQQSLTGPRWRLQGELIAGAGAKRWAARSAIVPQPIADAVQAVFAEHPPSSTRDRVTVHIDFDVWAIRERASALGERLHCEGRAYVPAPLSALVAQSFSRPVPTAPSQLLGDT
jgi:hypothetical protein